MAARWQGEHGKAIVKENRKQVALIRHTWTGTDRVQLNKKRREGEPERNAYVICDHVKRIFASVGVGVEYVHASELSITLLQRNNAERTVTTRSTVERVQKRWDVCYSWTNGRIKKK
jgi:hypothetical protein